MIDNTLLDALNSVPVAGLTYGEWISVGMALRHEGADCSVWDDWSRKDSRYHPGECERKWQTFDSYDGTPVTGATIIHMAQERGWAPAHSNHAFDWNDPVSDTGYKPGKEELSRAASQLIVYLKTLFKPDEYVSYVTESARVASGKLCPKGYGSYSRTAGEIIDSLERYGDDIESAIGSYNPEAGAWIRPNPVDGKGVNNGNITRFGYVLVESDIMPVEDQKEIYQRYKLPVACLVSSAGKSLHAIVRIDAKDREEYRERVKFLYSYLEEHGMKVDEQDKNPARLSRMPGVYRNGDLQELVAINQGKPSWAEWRAYVENGEKDLDDFISMSDVLEPPPLAPELIEGLLRQGHKLLLSGASKAGKSFMLMELGICLSEGRPWLGMKTMKSKVLYINMEIDGASCINRLTKIYDAYGIKPEERVKDGMIVWNMRGHAMSMDKLVPLLVGRIKDKGFNVIIIDPIYKCMEGMGDENSASDMARLCNQFDVICNETGCSVIYAHHHSKGAQNGKSAQDRASGSGVFARDPDAMVDLMEIDLEGFDKGAYDIPEECTAWKVEFIAREFRRPKPIVIWFKFPLHEIDTSGQLEKTAKKEKAEKAPKEPKKTSVEEVEDAFNEIAGWDGTNKTTMGELVKYMLKGNTDPKAETNMRMKIRRACEKSTYIRKDDNGVITLRNGVDTDEITG